MKKEETIKNLVKKAERSLEVAKVLFSQLKAEKNILKTNGGINS